MRILAIDTSTVHGGIALVDNHDNLRICEKVLTDGWQHGRLLIASVQELLRERALTLREIDAVAVGNGAGSYTGTRIGVIAAKTLAWAENKPLFGGSSLAAAAYLVARTNCRIVVIQDARRDEVYTGVYEIAHDGKLTLYGAEVALTPTNAALLLNDNCGVVIGNGWEKYPEIFAPYRECGIEFIAYNGTPTLARGVGELVVKNNLSPIAPLSLVPHYLRRDESPCTFERFMSGSPNTPA